MRKFVAVFILLINFLILGVNASALGNTAQIQNSAQQQILNQNDFQKRISVDFRNYETAVLNINRNSQEISALEQIRDNTASLFGANGSLTYNFNSNKFSYYDNIFANSHNISLCLKDEICTRAP